ncbi:MAG: DUF2807 domain-containing protein [Sphingomonadales bacterium]|nr:DUF2807 domain-containing protein [Sphingomonadales bacterium]
MKIPHWLIALALVTPSAAAAPAAAAAAERTFGLTSFDHVRIEGDYIVEISEDRHVAAVATGDRDALDLLDVEIRDRTLHIRRKQYGKWGSADGVLTPVVIRLTTVGLKSATLSGGGSLALRDIDSSDLTLRLNGPGRLDATGIAADTMALSLDGAGSIAIAGSARTLTAQIKGSGRVDAHDLAVKSLSLVNTGSASARFTADRDATIMPRGIGRIEISGNAPCRLKGKGTGNITCASGQPLADD